MVKGRGMCDGVWEALFEEVISGKEYRSSRCASNDYASQPTIHARETTGADEALGGLKARLEGVDGEEKNVNSSPSDSSSDEIL